MVELFESLHWGAIFQIVLIDILLGGDNAVVIALACRNLPQHQRVRGIIWGTAGAILLRVLLIAFALTLLEVPFLKLVGAALLLWIGIKLLIPDTGGHGNVKGGTSLWSAIRTIIIADFVMSLDNVLAIAAAANNTHLDHQLYYVIFGLLLSVPIIVWGSTLILRLIDRFPIVVTFGAALLGWIAGSMLINDTVVVSQLAQLAGGAFVQDSADAAVQVVRTVQLAAEITGAIIVVAIGKWRAGKMPTVKD